MMRIFLLVLLIILVSCQSHSQKEREKNFDVPLMTQNERLRLSGEYDSLVNLNKKYYKKAEETGYEEGKALCYINLAQINISLENYQKSKILFDKAEKILKNSENNIHKAIFYNNYGRLNNELGRIDKAFAYNNTALNCVEKDSRSKLKNRVLYNVYIRQGQYYVQKNQYNKALEFFNKARKFDNTGIADCAISDYVYMYKNKDSAYKYIVRAYQQMSLIRQEDAIALNIRTIMGEYYLAYGEYEKAEKEFLQALEIDKKTRRIFSQYTKYIYNDLRRLYDKMGDKEKAYFYLNAYTEAKNKTNTALLATINHDMESFITLTQENTEKHKSRIQWVILFSLAGLSLLGIYAWRAISILRKRKTDLKLEAEHLKARMTDNKQEEIMELGRNNDPDFLKRFKEIYPEFIDQLLAINPGLENSELAFCAMLKLHFTSKEIASYILVQHRTVQQKKYRIRKKLNIPGETDIYDFFDALG